MLTSQTGTTAQSLIGALLDARRVELGLLEGLGDAQLLGVRGHFLEPPIWEMGHVGWFQEYWLLRRLDGAGPLLSGADGIYDAFNVSYTRRWDHAFPSRAETLAYITTVLERSVARLESREPDGDDTYFYTLVAQHEDMHAENLTVILQTLGHAWPRARRRPWIPRSAGTTSPCPAAPSCSAPVPTSRSSSTTRSGRIRSRSRRSGSRRRR
jgi:iron(II)-dependent oxidoreductase